MGVVVVGSNALIGFVIRQDAHHQNVRARTGLLFPGAYALATAIHAEKRGLDDVRIASFDQRVLRAHAELHPNGPNAS